MFAFKDKETLINDIISDKPNSHLNFLESVPMFLENNVDTRQLIEFISSAINFGDINNAKKMLNIMPYLIKTEDDLISLLEIINEIIICHSIFIEEETVALANYIFSIFDGFVIESFLFESLEKIVSDNLLEVNVIVFRIQTITSKSVSNNYKREIMEKAFDLSTKDSSFVKLVLLNSVNDLLELDNNKSKYIVEKIILPCFKCKDFRVVARAIKVSTQIHEHFFAVKQADFFETLANNQSWSIRYAFSTHAVVIIRKCANPERLLEALIRNCCDKVDEVKLVSINSLKELIDIVDVNHKNIEDIIKYGIKNTQEVRNAVVLLWKELINVYPDASLHVGLSNYIVPSIGLIQIESFVYQILRHILPILPFNEDNYSNIEDALFTLLESKDKPQLLSMAIDICSTFLKTEHLRDIAKEWVSKFTDLLDSPIFAIRAQISVLLVDYSVHVGWDWSKAKIFPHLVKKLQENDSMTVATSLRGIVAMMQSDPPTHIVKDLEKMMLLAKKCKGGSVEETLKDIDTRISGRS